MSRVPIFGDVLLRERDLRSRGGPVRMRDAAAALGVPEAALLEARLATGAARRLRPADGPGGFRALVERLPEAGEVMALTRNESCVHEKTGQFTTPDIGGVIGQVVGEIDLRLFLRHWCFAYALEEETKAGQRLSLQVFDAAGVAVHKVYATAATDRAAFERIASDLADPEPEPARFAPPRQPEQDRPDDEIDRTGFVADWMALGHTHEFFGLLLRYGVGREQAMRLGGPDLARPVGPDAARRILTGAAAAELPVMVFVGNRGCVQIHSGPVHRVEVMGPWLNVLDPRFNLHLREDRIAGAWLVRKPSVKGDIHSLELYDAEGECFAQIFGQRSAGMTERSDWRGLITTLA